MRLASFRHSGRDRIGFAAGDSHLIDLADAAVSMGRRRGDVPADMIALIEMGDAGLALLQEAQAQLAEVPGSVPLLPLEEVEWHPPVRRPGKVCGIAMNNSASDARKISAPPHPMFFLKPPSCLIGHRQAIETRPYYGSVHPEPELGVVIGRRCRDVSEAEAMDVVYGYTIVDDVTSNGMRAEDRVHYYALYAAEDDPNRLERREQHLSYTARYKGSDTFGPMGPWLVTKDAVPDPHALEVRCWHDGELIAEDSTRYYTWGVPAAIAFITRFHSLWPGDVISMGTAFRPGGGKRSLHLANLTALGGTVDIEITGLGRLSNPVRRLGA